MAMLFHGKNTIYTLENVNVNLFDAKTFNVDSYKQILKYLSYKMLIETIES